MLRRLNKRATASTIVANFYLLCFQRRSCLSRAFGQRIFGVVTVTLVIYRKNLWLLFWSAIRAARAVLGDFRL